jgi:hypothetical protein
LEKKIDLVENFFKIEAKKELDKRIKKDTPNYIIKDGIYYPISLYFKNSGYGVKSEYRGQAMESIFINYPDIFFDMFYWIKYMNNGIPLDSKYRLRINWLLKSFSFSLRPKMKCGTSGCNEESRYFSTRRSSNDRYTYDFSNIACANHKDALDCQGEGMVKIHPLSLDTLSFFQLKKDKKDFFIFLHSCYNFKKIDKDNLFISLKFNLPAMKIDTMQSKEIFQKNNLNQVQLRLF